MLRKDLPKKVVHRRDSSAMFWHFRTAPGFVHFLSRWPTLCVEDRRRQEGRWCYHGLSTLWTQGFSGLLYTSL